MPFLCSKIYLTAVLAVLMQAVPFSCMILLSLLELIFLVFLVVVRPFESSFSNFKLLLISLWLLGVDVVLCVYLYFSEKNEYLFLY